MAQVKTIVNTPTAPRAIGPYSHAVRVGNTVYVSGQVGSQPGTGKFEAGIAAQTRQTLVNVGNILQAAGMSLSNVVKCTVYLASMDDYKEMNRVYAECEHSRAVFSLLPRLKDLDFSRRTRLQEPHFK
ncbi:rutC family protein C23G10.2-like isoform X2 [Haemaphysalis longicornis]